MKPNPRLAWLLALLFSLLFVIAACAQDGEIKQPNTEMPRVTYEASDEDFTNPERGFYADAYFTTEEEPNTLDAAALVAEKREAGFAVSLIHRTYYLPGYRDAATLPAEFLATVEADLASARAAGVKLVLRFAYRPNANYEGEPIYRDPTRSTILQHLDDLEPILQANEAVIAYVDAGLIGAWGEWHSATPNNGDDDPANDPDGPLLDELPGSPDPVADGPGGDPNDPNYNLLNWDRKLPNALTLEIVEKLLEVVPASRPVGIRYPLAKAALLEDDLTADLTEPLDDTTAHQNTLRARLGAINDCFLASADDFGTYYYGGIPGLEAPEEIAAQIEREKDFLNQDNLFVPMGGETCADEPYTDPAFDSFVAYAQNELERMRWTTLNIDYNLATLNELGDYLEEVKKRLGYRFVLASSSLPETAEAGGTVDLALTLENVGYASPFNPRGVEVIFRAADGTLTARPVEVSRDANTDPRFWQPGETQEITLSVAAPEAAGSFEVLLNLPDPLLPNVVTDENSEVRANYAIRLANEGVWEADSGMNKLEHTLTVR